MDASFTACEAIVRRADPDRYFSALFAPAGKRPLLFALYAFNHELARVGDAVREPMMGEIRLQWWRETVEGAREGKPRSHPLALALAALFAEAPLPAEFIAQMIDARAFDFLSGSFSDASARDAYLDNTSGNLMRLAARVLGGEERCNELAREAGIAYGLAGLIRSQAFHRNRGKVFLPDTPAAIGDARQHHARARALPKAGGALAAFLPAALVPLYLRNPAKEVRLHRRQMALLGAAMRGRI